MNFDFSAPITAYELIAVILSVSALLIPLIKGIVKIVKRPKIEYYSAKRAYLF